MIPGHLPQAWRKPRGVPIPDTQFSFGGEEDDGGDEGEILSSDFHGSGGGEKVPGFPFASSSF